jgi:hypothetical protein
MDMWSTLTVCLVAHASHAINNMTHTRATRHMMNPDRNTSINLSFKLGFRSCITARALHALSRGSVGLHVALSRCQPLSISAPRGWWRGGSLRRRASGSRRRARLDRAGVHASTMAGQGRSGVAASAQISLRASAVTSPGSRHGAETPETYGEPMTDTDSSTESGA